MTNSNIEDEWWSPQAISQQESRVRALAEQGQLDTRNDFASYRALADGEDPISAGLHHHNPYKPEHIAALCRDYHNLFQRLSVAKVESIADLGCGAGYTTAGLKRAWPESTVEGIDVSHDAVRFANTQWTDCNFTAKAINPSETLSARKYDFILCQEFYPFTRTESIAEHEKWLKFLLLSLSSHGVAVITVSTANTESINSTFAQLRETFSIRRFQVATPRISQRLPFWASLLFARVLSLTKPTWARSVYVLGADQP